MLTVARGDLPKQQDKSIATVLFVELIRPRLYMSHSQNPKKKPVGSVAVVEAAVKTTTFWCG